MDAPLLLADASPRRPRPRWLGWGFAGALALLLATTGDAFLASSSQSGSTVQTVGLSGSGGAAFTVAAASSVPVTVTRGHAQLLAGVETATIQLAGGLTSPLLINVDWLDPQDGSGVLRSPNAYILAGVYEEDATATASIASAGCPAGEYEIVDSANAAICVRAASGADPTGLLTREAADTLLQVNTSGLTTAYVLLSLYVSGNAPPNQQSTLPQLRFYVSGQLA